MGNENKASDLSLVIGDSMVIEVSVKEGLDTLKLKTGDTLFFSVKKRTKDLIYVLQKTVTEFNLDGSATIKILPQDTQDLDVTTYKYDIQVTFQDGTVSTIIEVSDFELRPGITHD